MRQPVAIVALALLAASPGGAARPEPSVTYLPGSRVSAAFEHGEPLLEVPAYKIHASRREAAGMAEVHERDTDIIYVLEGTAKIVTGGEVVDGKTTAPGEIRGASIRNGEARSLAAGDVMVVPSGVPHWFVEVEAPFLYYVVKVTGPPGS